MAESDIRHPIIVDTDALIAVANTSLWPLIVSTLNITTNVCIHELKRHTREKSAYAPGGTREKWVHTGSKASLKPFEDAEVDAFAHSTGLVSHSSQVHAMTHQVGGRQRHVAGGCDVPARVCRCHHGA